MDEHKDIQKPPNHGEQADESIRRRRDEEFAAEMLAEDETEINHRETDSNEEPNVVYGWIGIALSALSFFIMPIILGAAGIILGFVSRSRGANMLGNIAIIAGAVSILFSVFLWPLV